MRRLVADVGRTSRLIANHKEPDCGTGCYGGLSVPLGAMIRLPPQFEKTAETKSEGTAAAVMTFFGG
jgi:hypothetical protein